MVIAVILVRSQIGTKPNIRKTLRLLKLTRKNHCVVLKEDSTYKGMLTICKDYITWGPISKETLLSILRKRGKYPGDKKLTLTDEELNDLIDAIEKGGKTAKDKLMEKKIKPVFRCHPPKKGWKSIKKAYPKGALGFRGENMNNLIMRMI